MKKFMQVDFDARNSNLKSNQGRPGPQGSKNQFFISFFFWVSEDKIEFVIVLLFFAILLLLRDSSPTWAKSLFSFLLILIGPLFKFPFPFRFTLPAMFTCMVVHRFTVMAC